MLASSVLSNSISLARCKLFFFDAFSKSVRISFVSSTQIGVQPSVKHELFICCSNKSRETLRVNENLDDSVRVNFRFGFFKIGGISFNGSLGDCDSRTSSANR